MRTPGGVTSRRTQEDEECHGRREQCHVDSHVAAGDTRASWWRALASIKEPLARSNWTPSTSQASVGMGERVAPPKRASQGASLHHPSDLRTSTDRHTRTNNHARTLQQANTRAQTHTCLNKSHPHPWSRRDPHSPCFDSSLASVAVNQ